jgi:hypothetical protein
MIEIKSSTPSEQGTGEFLRRLKETGYPLVLSLDGKAELVVQDAGSYQKLLELAERADEMEALRAAVEEMRAGKGEPVEEMLAEARALLTEKLAR